MQNCILCENIAGGGLGGGGISKYVGVFPDIVEASGMRNYHCGGTDRSVDTVQVSYFDNITKTIALLEVY